MNAREAAYKSLLRIDNESRYSALELDSVMNSDKLDDKDKALYTSLLYGVTERAITLDYIISLYSSKPLSRLDKSTLILLRTGVYQIYMLDKVPDSAAVNETVKLAARYSARSKGYINAVLRAVSCDKDGIHFPDPDSDRIKYLSVKYSLPEWICRSFIDDYPDEGERIFDFVNSNPCITLRTNELKISTEELLSRLDTDTEKCRYSRFGIRLKEHVPVGTLELDNGLFFIQDEASQIECIALGAEEGDTVVDVCACPGGKSFSAAVSMKNKGKIFAFDIHGSKLPLIDKEAAVLGIDIIETAEHDSTVALPSLIGAADKVICDVPCSGLGVLHKKSDLRYKPEESVYDLPELQYKILVASSRYLKPGGILVYSTCTLRKAENEQVVERFLSCHPEFHTVPFDIKDIHSDGMLTLMPHIHGTDGFFIAKIRKK